MYLSTENMTNEQVRQEIRDLLFKACRTGMNSLLMHMDKMGFFEAPCSGAHHLAEVGGLARHSLNVYYLAQSVADLEVFDHADLYYQSIILVCLLHDLGKAGQFDKPGYVPNMLKGRPTKANPNPDPKQSETKPYEVNKALLPVAHETRSIVIASQFIDLTEDEQFAILYHNGMYGTAKYDLQGHETPLQMLLHFADMWASHVTEKEIYHGSEE